MPSDSIHMPRRRDPESGQFSEVYSEQEVVDVLEGGRLGTSEVAEELGCHRTTAHELLINLEADGVVESKRVGNTLMWTIKN
jgi:DNA-binding FadR family transcriptional regulator